MSSEARRHWCRFRSVSLISLTSWTRLGNSGTPLEPRHGRCPSRWGLWAQDFPHQHTQADSSTPFLIWESQGQSSSQPPRGGMEKFVPKLWICSPMSARAAHTTGNRDEQLWFPVSVWVCGFVGSPPWISRAGVLHRMHTQPVRGLSFKTEHIQPPGRGRREDEVYPSGKIPAPHGVASGWTRPWCPASVTGAELSQHPKAGTPAQCFRF